MNIHYSLALIGVLSKCCARYCGLVNNYTARCSSIVTQNAICPARDNDISRFQALSLVTLSSGQSSEPSVEQK